MALAGAIYSGLCDTHRFNSLNVEGRVTKSSSWEFVWYSSHVGRLIVKENTTPQLAGGHVRISNMPCHISSDLGL